MPVFSGMASMDGGGALRLDRYISENLRLLSRSQIKARNLRPRVNGTAVKLSYPVRAGMYLELEWDAAPPVFVAPEDIPLDVLYEDARVVVVNKRQGMVVHPAAGNWSGTLMNALLARRGLGAVPGAAARQFIVHRLDKDTSGVIICAYDEAALRFLAAQFKARQVKKKYYALVHGVPSGGEGRIQSYICRDQRDRKKFRVSNEGGKAALTRYRLVRAVTVRGRPFALLRLVPETGRTHQLRVHLCSIGHPIVGDPLYGGRGGGLPRETLMLHARSLCIQLPFQSTPSLFSAPFPRRFHQWLTGSDF